MSTTQATETVRPPAIEMTLDDLLAHPDGVRYELVDGRLVELNMGAESTYVASIINHLLMSHCGRPPIARVFSEQGFACFPNRRVRMRRPDISLILAERMPREMLREGFTSIRPRHRH